MDYDKVFELIQYAKTSGLEIWLEGRDLRYCAKKDSTTLSMEVHYLDLLYDDSDIQRFLGQFEETIYAAVGASNGEGTAVPTPWRSNVDKQ